MTPVSFTDRARLWREMEEGTASDWDIIIVGGGITGAGILREAVRRGYRSLLVEQRDFAWGTSSRSSKMVHGGLRYLAAGNLSLTRHALQERENLISEAPRLVERLGYYYPLYRKRFPPRFAASILFWLYDKLAGVRDHRYVRNAQLRRVFGQLDTAKLNGAYFYTDAVTDDARLVLRVLQESVREGASLRNYTKAIRLLEQDDRIHGLIVEDAETGATQSLQSRVVINATGAWAERFGKTPKGGLKIRPQRGSHLVLSAEIFPLPAAIFLLHPADGRRVFVYPWEGRTIIGTTDIYDPSDLDTAATMTTEELEYLLDMAQQLFPQRPPGKCDVISSWSGVRPIITSGDSDDPSKASREHKVWVEEGLVSCSGGKLTTFHHMALDVLDKAERFLEPTAQRSGDHIFDPVSLTGGDIMPEDPERGERLLGRYGEQAQLLLSSVQPTERTAIPGTRICLAQARWALAHESVVHLDDLMLRRTRLGLLLENGGDSVLDDIRRICQEVSGWSEQKWHSELERYREIINRYHAIPADDGAISGVDRSD